jgi:excisionase family DNA binding protein
MPPRQASRWTGLSLSTLYARIRTGELETATLGRRRLIITDSLKRLIESHSGEFSPHPLPWQAPENAPSAPKSGRRRTVTKHAAKAAPSSTG